MHLRITLCALVATSGTWLFGPQPRAQDVAAVSLDVVVTDRQGEPITSLQRSDFIIEEDGKRATLVTAAPVRATEGRTAIIVLDDTAPPYATARIRELADAVLSLAAPGDRVAIRKLHAHSDEIVDFDAQISSGRVINFFAGVIPWVPGETSDEYMVMGADLSGRLAAPPGTRKAIICIGATVVCSAEERVLTSPRRLYPNWLSVIAAASQSNVAFYTMVPEQLWGPSNPKQRMTLVGTVADRTGGETFIEPFDSLAGARQIWRDLSAYYIVQYIPPAAGSGPLRKVSVRVRRPDVTVRARTLREASTTSLFPH